MDVRLLPGFHFLHPAWLLALPPLMALAAWSARRRSAHDGTWARLVDEHLLAALRLSGAGRGRSPWILVGLAWILAVLALAAPSWQRAPSMGYRTPAAWVLLLDLSPSMDAADLLPDRATRARFAVSDLLSAAQDARVALVAFAGESYTVTPLTTDVATVRTLLEALSPSLMPEAGHQLAPALAAAWQLLQGGHAGNGQVIVLADGFDDGESALSAATSLAQHGVTIHVVGIGTEGGAPQRDASGEFLRDERGDILITRLQTGELERLAAAGGGRFVTPSGLTDLIATLHAARSDAIDAGVSQSGAEVATWRNDGVWLLPPLLLLAALIARRGWV